MAAGATALAVSLLSVAPPASAAGYESSVDLGTAGAYSVLAGSTVTNTVSPTTLTGDVGVSPGSSITGFPPGIAGGATHAGDANAAAAQAASTAAYLDAKSRHPTGSSLGSAVVGGTYQPGVYNAGSSLDVSGAVTLDGQGDPNSVFVFQVADSMTTASSTSIVLIGNAQACNVFWQIGASATLGTSTSFVGSVMALASITVTHGTTVQGRALAQTGAVTLDDNVFTSAACNSTPTTTTATATPATSGGSTTVTATVAASGASTPTGTVSFTANGVAGGSAPIGANGQAVMVLPVGTTTPVDVVAHYGGLGSYAASSSGPIRVVVTAATTSVASTPGQRGVAAGGSGSGTDLANTGTDDVPELTMTATALLVGGAALTWTARSRRVGAHATAIRTAR